MTANPMVKKIPTKPQHPLPRSPEEWRKEIKLAWKDARRTKPFALLTGTRMADADLFHLAPAVCLKFRGMDLANKGLRDRITKGALATYVANEGKSLPPKMAFALCYLASHFVLDLIDDDAVQRTLDYYEGQLLAGNG